MKQWWILSFIVFLVTGGSCVSKKRETTVEQVLKLYRQHTTALTGEVDILVKEIESDAALFSIQEQFKKARYAYKKIEWLAEYYQPYTARFINGPALEEVEPEDKTVVIQPEGFQVVEEFLFPSYDTASKKELLQAAKILRSNTARLQSMATLMETTDAHVFDALRLQLFRIISLGISGFDSPIAQNSLPEAAASLHTIQHYIQIYERGLKKKEEGLHRRLQDLLNSSQRFLNSENSFVSLNRAQFITDFINPLSETLLAAQKTMGFPLFTEPRALQSDAPNLFAAGIFNADFYSPGSGAYSTDAKRLLGARLFYDPVLSANGSRSCASCHQPQKAFTDGLRTNTALNTATALRRNTPSLLNAALQPALFYDTRMAYLEDQAKDVITNKDEMHGSMEKAIRMVEQDAGYRTLFQHAFGKEKISEQPVKNAIASYVRSLVALNSRFDQYMRGQKTALTKTEINGFNLFMGKAKCGTCHFAPLFNGSNPPGFSKIDAEVIGVPSTADTMKARLDSDEGKFYANKIELYRFAFKTPTVRNSAVTGPYMHNGVFASLEEVIDFYDRGGGKGLGLNIENQTLPGERLNLTAYEKEAIVAFLKSLTDTTFAKFSNRQ